LPWRIVSSTTRGISCGVTRPYERYAPDGKRIYSQYTCTRTAGTHEHDASIAVSAKMVDVKHADLAAASAMHALDGLDAAPDLGLALGVGALDLLEGRTLKARERVARLVDCDAVLLEAGDECRPEDARGDVAALVARLVRA